jgi:hypothetical protein
MIAAPDQAALHMIALILLFGCAAILACVLLIRFLLKYETRWYREPVESDRLNGDTSTAWQDDQC